MQFTTDKNIIAAHVNSHELFLCLNFKILNIVEIFRKNLLTFIGRRIIVRADSNNKKEVINDDEQNYESDD